MQGDSRFVKARRKEGALDRARLPSAGKTCRRQDFGNNRKIVSNVYPFLPKLTMNGQFIRDFIAAESPCFALGLVEERKQQCGFLALRPAGVIPPEISGLGFNFGHALLGTTEFEVIQFVFHFYGFETYNMLVNPLCGLDCNVAPRGGRRSLHACDLSGRHIT